MSVFLTAPADNTAEALKPSVLLGALKNLNFDTILLTAGIFIIGYLLIKYAAKLFDRLLSRNEKLDSSIRNLIVTGTRLILLFLLFLTCADKLGLPTASILTLLGTFGLAFSLAMQNSLSNLAGGMFILSTKPFQTGDYISVPSAEGTVTRIGFIHTLLTTVDNRQIHVPNSTITGNTIVNYSQNSRRRLEITIPVPYECSLDDAKSVILDVIGSDDRVLEEPFVRVWNLSASSVDILIRVWCESGDYWELRSYLLEHIKTRLDEAGISIPYDQLQLHWDAPAPRP